MSFPGLPWRAQDCHKSQISQTHQQLRPIFKLRCSPYSPHLNPKSKDACRQRFLVAEPRKAAAPPPRREPAVAVLDSGCIQLSSIGNPVSYPLHLVLLLRVSFYISYICTHSLRNPTRTHTHTHITSPRICLNVQYHQGVFFYCCCIAMIDIL